ncbi:MAG: hypothetical protein J0I06_18140 [Planctomycetes bacterium]|nr:hypothetical protein [Planctomycetota bacterium]
MRRPAVALVVLVLAAPPAFAAAPAETLAAAETAFAEGVARRGDSVNAKPAFARAAAGYDVLWNRGLRSPELALNRSRAHRLAGNLPKYIAALHEGLAAVRFARPLQVELEDARAAVQFPLDGELAAQCRPRPYTGVGTRMSVADAWVIAGALWLVACAGVARFVMTRGAVWLVFAGLGAAALVALGALWIQDERRRERAESLPLLIVADDTTLRRGNAPAYPPRLDAVLPKGAEVRELSRRGGWVQVQLPGGAIGWLPASAVIACDG